jgi:eukaryotic-like serine/threonine-protein kinase
MHPLADAGRVIAGRYRLQAPIGRGAMGVVWRARDQLLDRDVAVKEVHIADTLTDDERAHAYQRTLREAKTAARLNHPAVVTVYDVAEDEGRPWIVMQLISAQSLDQVLASSGPLSPRRAAEVGRQLLSALSVAHAAGVMHRDVKPSNVLLGHDDRAVLTDFGIATFQGDPKLTQTGMVMGSPGFTAPERIRGEDASPASDLWSLGATLFAAVEGHGPFEKRGGALTTMSAIINEDAPEATAAGALGPVIAALLRREPGDRPDAGNAARMITSVLPLLTDQTGGAPAGYVPTALSASAPPKPPPPSAPPTPPALDYGSADYGSADYGSADRSSADYGSADYGSADYGSAGQTISREAFDQGAPDTGPPAPAQLSPDPSAPTAAVPVLGDPQWPGSSSGHGGAEAYPGEAYGSASAARPAGPPPDFSSWYDQSPRSGAVPQPSSWSGYPHPSSYGSGDSGGSGAAAGPGPGSGSAPGASSAPRSGLWWKIALVLLALIGAGAGVATVVLLHHNNSANQGPGSTRSTPAAGRTLAPASLVTAINQPLTGAPAAGYRSLSRPAAGTEAAGFTIDLPTGWTVTQNGPHETYLTDPGTNINMLVDLTPHTYPNDMVAEARYIEGQSIPQFPGYQRIDLRALNIRGTAGSFWKFTWTKDAVSQEALDLLFVINTSSGSQSYALYATAPATMWTHLQPVFDEELRTFAPLPK